MQILKQILIASLFSAAVTGCALFGDHDKPAVTVRLHEQVSGELPPTHVLNVKVPKTDLQLTVNPFPTLTEKDVRQADIYNTSGGSAILLRFDTHGIWVLEQMTTEGRGRYIVTFLNGRPVAALLVEKRLTNGQFLLEGDFTDEEAKAAVEAFNAAAKKRTSRFTNAE